MVLNTSDDLPDPETPVNTVSRRLGISTLTSFRLFIRAPWTRMRSWLSAGCWPGEIMLLIISSSIVEGTGGDRRRRLSWTRPREPNDGPTDPSKQLLRPERALERRHDAVTSERVLVAE